MRRYETAGVLEIYCDGTSDYHNGTYRRWLDLQTATTGVEFDVKGILHQREFFSSAPDNVTVYRLTASNGSLSFQLRLGQSFSFGGLNVIFDWACNQEGDPSTMTATSRDHVLSGSPLLLPLTSKLATSVPWETSLSLREQTKLWRIWRLAPLSVRTNLVLVSCQGLLQHASTPTKSFGKDISTTIR